MTAVAAAARVLTDPDAIARRLRRDPTVQLYALGDLDEPYWPDTTWWGLGAATAVLLQNDLGPVLTLMGRPGDPDVAALAAAIGPDLPAGCFVAAGLGAEAGLARTFDLEPHGTYLRFVLADREVPYRVDADGVTPWTGSAEELEAFYAASLAPGERGGAFLSPDMLATGAYVQVRDAGGLVAVAGVHLCSERYGVAAIGNVTTASDRRGEGLATRATAAVCRLLLDRGIPVIGLNVRDDNGAARRAYERLGFAPVCAYGEWVLTAR